MPIGKHLPPATTRDHEIIALTNEFLARCANQNHAVILAALSQAFLAILEQHRDWDDFPEEVSLAAELLSLVTINIRALPQDTLQ